MRSRWVLAMMIAVVFGIALVDPAPVAACGCEGPSDYASARDDSSVTFSGTVITQRQRMLEAGPASEVDFEVDRVWKGRVGSSIRITAYVPGGMCGYTFWTNQAYIVFAHAEKSRLFTNQCALTSKIEGSLDQALINAIGPGTSPDANIAGPNLFAAQFADRWHDGLWVFASLFGVIICAAVGAYRQTRGPRGS